MDLTEDEIIKKTEKNVDFAIEILFYHTNMNLLAYRVDIMQSEENTNLLNVSEKKKFINRLKYAEHKIFCICIQVYKIYAGDVFDKMYEIKNKK